MSNFIIGFRMEYIEYKTKRNAVTLSHLVILAFCAVFLLASCDRNVGPEVPDNAFRELLANMDWGNDTCYVYGHKTPDSDAICSSLAYAGLMRSLGYNCVAKISSKANNETKYISKLFGFDIPALKPSVTPGTRLIATDHEEYLQSVDGARDGRILQIIDHHQEGDMATPGVAFIYRDMIGSTCTLVWELFQEAAIPVDDVAAHIMLAGLMSDTRNLAKDNTTQRDSVAWLALSIQLHLTPDSLAVVYSAMEEALTSYDGMSDYDIFVSDYKDYDIAGVDVGIGCVEWTDYTTMDDLIDRMLSAMPQALADKNRKMVFCMATRYVPNPDTESASKVVATGTYILYYGEGAREVAESAIGPSLREGVCYSEERLSRKTQFVPMITEILGK